MPFPLAGQTIGYIHLLATEALIPQEDKGVITVVCQQLINTSAKKGFPGSSR
jgi:hypothetical protein